MMFVIFPLSSRAKSKLSLPGVAVGLGYQVENRLYGRGALSEEWNADNRILERGTESNRELRK